ncbi:MAG: SDR family NAD(P)-dependent oxidoreductase [Acidobacteria bacterium]|nr:SDR family NAD(P)-dependent oxidoreductase [Acidobacteriota bacterium]
MKRIAVITGASGALGKVVTAQFEQAGYQVVPVRGVDLSNPAEAQRVLDEAGAFHVLVHLVGGFEMGSSDEAWHKLISMNMLAAVPILREAAVRLAARSGGHIVAIGAAGAEARVPGMAAYVATKAALHAFIEVLAKESASDRVFVNAVLPGTIDTDEKRALVSQALLELVQADSTVSGSLREV